MSLNERFGELFEEHLNSISKSRTKIYRALAEVLPYSSDNLAGYVKSFVRGNIFHPHTTYHRSLCLSVDEKRNRRSQILYALGVEKDSELIGVLRKLDPKTEYPPEDCPLQISLQQVRQYATLSQKIRALSGPEKAQVEELVDALYKKYIIE